MGQAQPDRELTSTIHLGLRGTVKAKQEVLAHLSESDLQAIGQLPQESALLISLSPSGQGQRFLVNEDLTSIGRLPESEIFLSDITVSRRHAEIVRIRKEKIVDFLLKDLGSLNGSYINNVAEQERTLQSGDEVQIGKFRFLFIRGEE